MQKWQVDILEQLPEAARAVPRAKFLQEEQLNDGTFWTPLEELYKPSPAPFKNGYKAICLRMANEEWERPQDYQQIVNDLKAQAEKSVVVDVISLHSASTKNSERSAVSSERNTDSKTPKPKNRVATMKPKESFERPDCLGGDLGNKGHIIPAPKTLCAPRYGIITQPIIGFSFEDFMKSKIEEEARTNDSDEPRVTELNRILIRILQKSVISDKKPHGIASRVENLLYVPKSGHEEHFDNGCQWFFIPVMTLEDALKWTSGQEYKVMVIAGDLKQGNAEFSAKLHRLLMPRNVLKNEEIHCLLDEDEIRMATALLEDFVKALADVATGRGEAGTLTPDKLDREDKEEQYKGSAWRKKLEELEEGRKNLEGGMVMIPDLKVPDFSNVKVLGLTLRNGPDPALLGIKDAIGWMTQNGQRPLPACERSGEAAEDDDTGSTGEDSFQGITSTPNVPKFVCASPSPTRDRTPSRLSLLREDSFGGLSEDSSGGSQQVGSC